MKLRSRQVESLKNLLKIYCVHEFLKRQQSAKERELVSAILVVHIWADFSGLLYLYFGLDSQSFLRYIFFVV